MAPPRAHTQLSSRRLPAALPLLLLATTAQLASMVGAALPPAAAASCASLSSLGKRPTCEARKDCHWCSTMFVECQPKAAKCQPASAALSNSTGTAATAGRGLNCSDGLLDKSRTCCCDTHCGTCGGTSCQNHPGGRDKCCCSVIRANGRRCDREPAPCTMPPAPPAPPPPPLRPAHTVNPKRGFVADSTNCDDAVLLNASGWFYNYNLWNPYRVQSGQRKSGGNCTQALSTGRIDARFTPMNWCLSGMKERPAPTVNASYFMGFNEPNNLHNCNTDAQAVAEAWATVMKQWPHSMLVSPATAGNGIAWFDDFFGNCSKLYGKRGCNISYLAAHDYSCTPATTLSYLKRLHERYGYPVWLTEFSCGDGASGRPTKDHVEFMRAILPLLDAADFVYRYSWMSASDGHGLRGLLESAAGDPSRHQLTELGQIWNSAT